MVTPSRSSVAIGSPDCQARLALASGVETYTCAPPRLGGRDRAIPDVGDHSWGIPFSAGVQANLCGHNHISIPSLLAILLPPLDQLAKCFATCRREGWTADGGVIPGRTANRRVVLSRL